MQSNKGYLDIENIPGLLAIKTKYNTPIWFYMRNFFYEKMSEKLNGDIPVKITRKKGIVAFKYLLKSCFHNFKFINRKADVTFFSISRELKENGLFYDQYVDGFVKCKDYKAIVIQHPPINWEWKFPRYNNEIIFSGFALAVASIKAYFCYKKDGTNIDRVFELAYKKAKEIFDLHLNNEEKNIIKRSTQEEIIRMHYFSKWFIKRNLKMKTKIVIMLGGSYSWYYEINRGLKARGIKTADLQHGCFSSSNPVYNYGNELLKEKCVKEAAPTYLLTYGKWWTTQTNIPYESKIAIGNFYRTCQMAEICADSRKQILIIGCNRKTKQYIELAEYLSKELPEFDIIFRPHPTERLEATELLKEYSGAFSVDLENPLYETLSKSEAIVSEVSTVLFEAIGRVAKIFVWNTSFSKYLLPECPFPKFVDFSELKEMILKGNYQMIHDDLYWEQNTIEKFEDFIKESL